MRFFLILYLFTLSNAFADSQIKDSLHDNAVAVSVLSKVAYINNPPKSDKKETGPIKIEMPDPRTIALLRSDFEHFTDTKRGLILKQKGLDLVNLLLYGSLTPSNPYNPTIESVNDPLRKKSPAELEEYVNIRIHEYLKLSNAPEWLYKIYKIKMENKAQ